VHSSSVEPSFDFERLRFNEDIPIRDEDAKTLGRCASGQNYKGDILM
jgi:hypothetical protein